jgi:hypothetical protein
VKKITAYDRAASDLFGGNVAISGDTVMVGVWADNDHTGSAYIFRRDANGDGIVDWGFVKKLTPPTGSDQDSFGVGIAIDGDTAVIGASDQWDGPGPGAAHVYREQTPGNWQLEATLAAADGVGYNNFGSVVGIRDDVIFIRSYELGGYTPATYIFKGVGAGQWIEVRKLTSDAYDICFSGDRVVTGAPGDIGNSGSASVFLNADVVAGAAAMSASPDGAYLYVARPDRDTLSVFERDAVTGALTFIEEMADPVHLE